VVAQRGNDHRVRERLAQSTDHLKPMLWFCKGFGVRAKKNWWKFCQQQKNNYHLHNITFQENCKFLTPKWSKFPKMVIMHAIIE
jgi:hypothetical protein